MSGCSAGCLSVWIGIFWFYLTWLLFGPSVHLADSGSGNRNFMRWPVHVVDAASCFACCLVYRFVYSRRKHFHLLNEFRMKMKLKLKYSKIYLKKIWSNRNKTKNVSLNCCVRMSICLWMLRWSSYWWTNCSFYVKFVLQSCSLSFWDVVIVTDFILNCVPLQRFCVNDTTFR